MTYNITKSDGSSLVSIPDNTLDTTSTSLTLVGKNSVNFGLATNQDFVYLLQNFANTNAPNSPLQGQLWYDTNIQGLRVYNGSAWNLVTPPFDGTAGIVTAKVSINNINVIVSLSNNNIISITSNNNIVSAQIPDYIILNDVKYNFKSLFPNGIQSGITLATRTSSPYKFVGSATSADSLTTPIQLNMAGDLSGSTEFDGTSNITITASLNTIYVANTNSNVSGTYNTVSVDNTGRVITGQTIPMPPIGSIILWTNSVLATGWNRCDGSTVNLPGGGTYVTPNLSSFTVGSAFYIVRIF